MGISCRPPTVPKCLVHVTRIKQKTLNIYYVPGTELDPVDTKIKKNGLICFKLRLTKGPLSTPKFTSITGSYSFHQLPLKNINKGTFHNYQEKMHIQMEKT